MGTPGDQIAQPEIFAPERSFQTPSLAEALEACETMFRYTCQPIEPAHLSLNEQFTVTINNQDYRLTEKAFDDLCHILDVPLGFAKKIPLDLHATIVNRLKTTQQQTIIPSHRDDVIVGFIDPSKWSRSRAQKDPQAHKISRPLFSPVPTIRVLELIQTIWGETAETRCILLTNTGAESDLMHAPVTIEPRPGDVTHLGLVITTSETGGPMPQARGYTLRLMCSNSAFLPHDFSVLRFSMDWRVKMERRLEAFAHALWSVAFDMQKLHRAYGRLAAESLIDEVFYRLHRQSRYIYRRVPHDQDDEDPADRVLGVDQARRKHIIEQVRDRQERRRNTSSVLETPQATDVVAWDMLNAITETARSELYQRRIALEHLAGDVLHAFAPEHMD